MKPSTKYTASITTIPQKEQRYRTIGDWFYEMNGELRVRVSNVRNKKYEFLVAMHELIEQFLCECSGITEQEVDSWDLMHENVDEPGALMKCPYREQHQFAEAIEKVLAEKIGVDWEKYGIALEAAMDDKSTAGPKPSGQYVLHPKPSRKALILQTQRILQDQEG